MLRVRAVPLQHNYSLGAGFDLIFTPAEGASEGMRGIAVVIKHQVRVPVAFEPMRNLRALVGDRRSHRSFCAGPVVPRGGCGDVSLSMEPLSEFIVGTAHMFAQRVTAGGFVL